VVRSLKALCQSQTDVPAPDDENVSRHLSVNPEDREDLLHLLGAADKQNRISRFDGILAKGDDQSVISENGSHDESQLAGALAQVQEGDASDGTVRCNSNADELDPAVGKLAHVVGAGSGDRPLDGLHHFHFGVDD